MTWQPYLAEFHRTRAGITEAVLQDSLDPHGQNPYQWLAAAASPAGRVVDVACGNAPLWPYLAPRPYLGVDLSAAELTEARRRGAHRVARASAAALPLATGSADLVVCSMALMIVADLPTVLAEVRRIIGPGGSLIATIPTHRPLHGADLPILAGLFAALGRRLHYPNDQQLSQLGPLLNLAGFRVEHEDAHRFAYPLTNHAAADRFLDSLYLPELPNARHRVTRHYLRSLSGHHAQIPIPIRRIRATTDPEATHRGDLH